MKKILSHIIFWSIIVIWRANGDYMPGVSINKFFIHNLVRLPVIIIATYFLTEYILPKYLINEKNNWKFISLFLINFIIANLLDKLMIRSDWILDIMKLSTDREYQVFQIHHLFRNSFMLFSIMGLASLIRFFQLLREKEQKAAELTEENLSTKLAFLKSQVNPHFLFNALNNIYSMAIQKQQTEIAAGIENLSGIMHYLTYESKAQFVPLTKEIELLKNYIDVQHLRIHPEDDVTISFQVEGDSQHKIIAPVMLLPLVENAFKHGIKPDRKCLVSIHVQVDADVIYFKTVNTLFEHSESMIKEKGIGLENVTKRLKILYPDQFVFTTSENNGYYTTSLKLKSPT